MKKILNNQCFMIIAAMIFFGAQKANAQLTSSKVASIMENYGWTKKADTRYAYLKESESTTPVTYTFYYGLEYAIVAYSDDTDVQDIDIQVCYPSGNVYLQDNEFDDISILKFVPPYDMNRGVKITNYSSLEKHFTSKCNFIIFYRTVE
ncbi:hypothetical protein DC498_02530 [Terrimonas sp.]|uniref:hypothetical protein n=1 Tax=Terrimonas sp. TaxID=1914338 RepID=UPI000D509580|nr:hypothetical protein [Terrimonas sp.]PVD54274.1 hypothetical protein DC498_02530 [Terrimonas sp.]